MLTAKFTADFSSFLTAVKKAEAEIKNFGTGADRVKVQLDRMVNNFSGRKIVQDATLMAEAIDRVGGPARLTAAELERVGAKAAEAAAKMKALGLEVPPRIQDLADRTKNLGVQTETSGGQLKSFISQWVLGIATLATATAAVRTLAQFVTGSVKAYGEAEAAQVKLAAALRASGVVAPAVQDSFNQLANEFQRTTAFSDDLITEMQALLVQVGGVLPTQMKGALTAATNLAAGLGIDLRAATLLVGKAFAGETGTLQKYGVQVDETALKTKGATAVLEAINAQFGGQAQAEVETYAGRLKQLANTWNDLEEAVGKSIVQDPLIKAALRATTEALKAQGGELPTVTIGWLNFWAQFDRSRITSGALALMQSYVESLNELADVLARVSRIPNPFEKLTAPNALPLLNDGLEESDRLWKIDEENKKRAKASAERAATATARLETQFRQFRNEIGVRQQEAWLASQKAMTSFDRVATTTLIPSLQNIAKEMPLEELINFDRVTTLKLIPSIQTMSKELKDVPPVLMTFGKAFEDVLGNLSGIFQRAFEGGGGIGGALKAIAVQLGADFAKMFTQQIQKALNSGASVFNAISVKSAGAAAALGGLGVAMSGASAKSAAASAAMAGVGVALNTVAVAAASTGTVTTAAVGGALAFGAATAGIGLAAVGAYYGLKKAFFDTEKKINPLRQAFIDASGGIDILAERARKAGVDLKALLDAKNTKQYEAAINNLNGALERHQERLNAVRTLIEHLPPAFNDFAAAGAKSVQSLRDMGTIALASIGTMIESGHSMADALLAHHDGLMALRESYTALGLSVDDAAIKAILLQDSIVSNNPQLLKAVGGLNTLMSTLGQLGLLNVETFGAMQRSGLEMYTKLQGEVSKLGGATADALGPMQEFLHDAEERAKDLGIPLDENLQLLIDQSKELGIWKDKGKSATDRMVEGIEKMVDRMDKFLASLLKIPDSLPDPFRNWDSPEQPEGGSQQSGGMGVAPEFGSGMAGLRFGSNRVSGADMVIQTNLIADGRQLAAVTSRVQHDEFKLRNRLQAA